MSGKMVLYVFVTTCRRKHICFYEYKKSKYDGKDILKISIDGDTVNVSMSDSEDIVRVVTELLIRQMSEGEDEGFVLLESIVIWLLAREDSGKLEEHFPENIRENVSVYRECYADIN